MSKEKKKANGQIFQESYIWAFEEILPWVFVATVLSILVFGIYVLIEITI